ncbi:MAG: hypothetical protein LBQ68_09330 [Clostridiales bacterium]|jgi:hypothetical protein|nr:hypothetical protein [Clostridiales bacterium]
MFKKVIFAALFLTSVCAAKEGYAQVFNETITPNELTIKWEDNRSEEITLDTFKLRGYNLAQLRTLVRACGGSIIETNGGYQIITGGEPDSSAEIGFEGEQQVKVQYNETQILDKSGNYVKPSEPGWVLLTDYNYNWGSIRDVLRSLGLEVKSYTDDSNTDKTTVVIGEIIPTIKGRRAFPTPTGFIGSKPMYVYYKDEISPSMDNGYVVKTFDDKMGESLLWIYARDGVKNLCIYAVEYVELENGEFGFIRKEKLFETVMSGTNVLEYKTIVPEGMPFAAVTFTEEDGKEYAYVISYDGVTGRVSSIPAELHDK